MQKSKVSIDEKHVKNVKVIFSFLDYNRSGLAFIKPTNIEYMQYLAQAKVKKNNPAPSFVHLTQQLRKSA